MFSLKDQLCKIVSVTNVSEKHGKERKPAQSIGLYIVGPSRMLDQFDPALRPGFYRKPQPKPGELPLDSDDLTELRFPFLRNLAWDRKYAHLPRPARRTRLDRPRSEADDTADARALSEIRGDGRGATRAARDPDCWTDCY